MWEIRFQPGVFDDLNRQRMHALDRITLRDRLRAFRRELLRTRGNVRHTVAVESVVSGGVRFVFERLDGLFTTHTELRRSWRWLWRRRTVNVVIVLALRMTPHPADE
jgi:hypothetical protein